MLSFNNAVVVASVLSDKLLQLHSCTFFLYINLKSQKPSLIALPGPYISRCLFENERRSTT